MPRFRGEAKRPRIRSATASVWMQVAAIVPCAVMAVAPNGAGAEDLPFTGTFQVIGLFPPFSMPGSGVASGTPLSFVLPPSFGPSTETQTVPATPLTRVRCSGCGLGSVGFSAGSGPSGGFGGDAGADGRYEHVFFNGLVTTGAPLSILGVDGAVLATPTPGGGTLAAEGGGWTTGTAVISGLGSPTPTLTTMGTDTRTPQGNGGLQLVAPMRVTSSAAGAYPVFGVLTLHFTPEPRRGLLLAAGALALTALARRRR